MTNFKLFQTEKVCRHNFKFHENESKLFKQVEKTWKMRNYSLRAISPFPAVFFKRLVLHTCKNQSLFDKELTHYQMTNFRHFQTERVCS